MRRGEKEGAFWLLAYNFVSIRTPPPTIKGSNMINSRDTSGSPNGNGYYFPHPNSPLRVLGLKPTLQIKSWCALRSFSMS